MSTVKLSPDHTVEFRGFGFAEVYDMPDGSSLTRAHFRPGWRWSLHASPLAGTDRCPMRHRVYCVRGSVNVETTDGTSFTFHAGDIVHIEPGHDAYTDEDTVIIDFHVSSHGALWH